MMRAHTLVGLAMAGAVVITACGSGPTASPPSDLTSAAFPSVPPEGLTVACDIPDRVEQSRCLIDAYVPLLNAAFETVVTSRGREFKPPRVETADAGSMTDCGWLDAPAYCPTDQTVVIPLESVSNLGDRATNEALERVLFHPAVREYFTRELTPQELAAGGSYAAVIATAHEYAHHVQNLIGAIDAYRAEGQADPVRVSKRIELEADCMTGWIAGYLNKLEVHVPALIDDWAAATTLTEISDDFYDPSIRDGGHGTVEERVRSWQEGLIAGVMLEEPYGACASITERILTSEQRAPSP